MDFPVWGITTFGGSLVYYYMLEVIVVYVNTVDMH